MTDRLQINSLAGPPLPARRCPHALPRALTAPRAPSHRRRATPPARSGRALRRRAHHAHADSHSDSHFGTS